MLGQAGRQGLDTHSLPEMSVAGHFSPAAFRTVPAQGVKLFGLTQVPQGFDWSVQQRLPSVQEILQTLGAQQLKQQHLQPTSLTLL